MLHGLLKDSAIVGTYKRAKHATKKQSKKSAKHRNEAEVVELVEGFILGFTGIAENFRDIKRMMTEDKSNRDEKQE